MWRCEDVNAVTGKKEHIQGGMANLPAGEGTRIIICHLSTIALKITCDAGGHYSDRCFPVSVFQRKIFFCFSWLLFA
jgi:hypothetical protein